MMKIPYGTQYIDQTDIDAVIETLKSPFMTQGPKVKEFEEKVAAYHGCKYAVAYSNGTAALHGAYAASGIKKGESFITSPITFAASANAGLYVGAIPKFADIDPLTYNLDPYKVKEKLTDDVRVVTPVSYAGYPVDLKLFREIVGQDRIIIHDAAHAIGARFEGRDIVTYADMTILSFHPVKHIAAGEGGMVLTNSKELYDKLDLFRSHGITKDKLKLSKDEGPWYYEMVELGYNYRLTDLQSALGISQLAKLNHSLFMRNKIAEKYTTEFENVEWIGTPHPISDYKWLKNKQYNDLSEKPKFLHSYHLYSLQLSEDIDRRKFVEYMHEKGIMVQVHYIPVHLFPYYEKEYGFKAGDFPIAENFYEHEVSIPMYPTLGEENQDYIIKTIKEFK